jgi:DNA-binding transcriptional MocR family regulator
MTRMNTRQFAPAFAEPAGSPIRELFPYLDRPGMISFAGGYPSPALLDSAGLQEASQQAWADAAACVQYGATEGMPALRSALAQLCLDRGISCEPSTLLVTTGSQQGYDILVRILLQPGDVVLMESPAYSAAIQATRLAGANIVQVESDAQGLRIDAMADTLRTVRGKPSFVYAVPTFSNPSGATLSRERRQALVELAVEHGFLIVEDDPYGELTFTAERLPTLFETGRRVAGHANPVVYLSSLSKTVAPALRVGWMIGSPAVLRRAAVAKQTMDLCTSPLVQRIAAHYLQSGRYPGAVKAACAEYGRRMAAMADAIDEQLAGRLRCTRPDGGLFLWGEWAGLMEPQRLFEAAVEAGVLFVPGAAFHADGRAARSMRLSYAAADTADILTGVQRLARAFDQASIKDSHDHLIREDHARHPQAPRVVRKQLLAG